MRLTPSFALVATLLVGCGGGPSTLTSPPGPAAGPGAPLIYPPGNFASTDELIAINSAAAPFGGVYITHMCSEADNFLEPIDEAIAKIDSSRAAGVDIQANMYPYTAGSAATCANKV